MIKWNGPFDLFERAVQLFVGGYILLLGSVRFLSLRYLDPVRSKLRSGTLAIFLSLFNSRNISLASFVTSFVLVVSS